MVGPHFCSTNSHFCEGHEARLARANPRPNIAARRPVRPSVYLLCVCCFEVIGIRSKPKKLSTPKGRLVEPSTGASVEIAFFVSGWYSSVPCQMDTVLLYDFFNMLIDPSKHHLYLQLCSYSSTCCLNFWQSSDRNYND